MPVEVALLAVVGIRPAQTNPSLPTVLDLYGRIDGSSQNAFTMAVGELAVDKAFVNARNIGECLREKPLVTAHCVIFGISPTEGKHDESDFALLFRRQGNPCRVVCDSVRRDA